MNKNKIIKDLKLYNVIMSAIWKLITTLILGILAGYLIARQGEEGNHYMLFTIIVFFIIGMINFFMDIYRGNKRLALQEAKTKAAMAEKAQADHQDEEV